MAFMLGCEKLSFDVPTKELFRSLSLGVNEGDRIGIVGRNGEGKSTLLRLLAGLQEPDEGRVIRTHGVQVGLLGQSDQLDEEDTVGRAIVGERPEYEWAGDGEIRSIIDGLVADIPWSQRVGELSGGQRCRVDLARLLVGDWDVLMLDEPTNHLDIRGITWLARHLKRRWRAGAGALLVVTHDRWFLDEVCTSMWEVFDRGIQPFEGGFSAYIMQRVERDRRAERAEQRRQSQLRRELAWLSRGARARATKPKFHVAAAQALIADVPPLRDEIELKRMAMARLGKQVVDVEGVTVSYGDQRVLDSIDWAIGPGDRFGVVGANGAGKSTLLSVIQGQHALDAGRVKIGKTVRFSALSQNLDELRAFGDDRVRQVIGRYNARIMLDGKDETPAQLLGRLGFSRADLDEPVCDLSGGQKRRLALMLMLLDEPNVLVLDEPGNDLDTDMLAAVEDLLDGWPGTLVLVTHDRYLMERVTDHQYALIDGHLRHLPRGIDEYLEIVAASERHDQAVSFAARVRETSAGGTSEAVASSASGPRLSGGEQRSLRKRLQSLERKMETTEGKIAQAKDEMAAADPSDYLVLGDLQDRISELEERRDALELEWLEIAETLDG